MRGNNIFTGIFVVSFAASTAGSAGAQTVTGSEPATQAPAADESSLMREIIVTARRREESAQTVPIAISSFSGSALQQKSVQSLEDLTRLTPGLRFSAEGGATNTTVSLRGLSKIPLGDGTPAVVTYFADVPLPAVGTNIPTFDIANVQVLKGPQGTLFGRNTIGGAVLVNPVAPSYDLEGYVSGTYGNFNYRVAEGAINLPIVDNHLAVRVAGQYRARDGFQKNVGTGPEYDKLNQLSLRGSILWEPSANIRNTLIVDYFRGHDTPPSTVFFRYTPGVLTSLAPPIFGPFEAALAQSFAEQQARGPGSINTDASGQAFRRRLWGVTNTTEIDLSDTLKIKNIFGFRSSYAGYMSDVDAGPTLSLPAGQGFDLGFLAPPFQPTGLTLDRLRLLNDGERNDRKAVTDELQLQGESLGGQVNWILGAFYSKESPQGPQGIFADNFDAYNSITGISISPATTSSRHTLNKSYAVFGQVGVDLSNVLLQGLKVDLGLRHTWDDVTVCGATKVGGTNLFDAPFMTFGECKALSSQSPTDGVGTNSTKTKAPTWTFGLNYQVTPKLFTYVTARRGYRQGGLNTPAFETPCTTATGPCVTPTGSGQGVDLRGFQTIGPERVDDIEIGLKSSFNLGSVRGRFNIDAYRTKYKRAVQYINAQCCIAQTDPGFPTNGSFGFNAGNLTIKGVEMDGDLVLFKDLQVSANASYIDQQVDSLSSVPAPFTLTAAQVTLPSPKWSGTFAARYTLPFKPLDGSLAISGDYYWTKKYQASGITLPGYELANFRLTWDGIAGSGLTASVFVNNAFDKNYIAGPIVALANFPINVGFYGAPRTYGLELRYKFGG